jgi:pimeloyl-ACP methyl ester carboxylesterase
MQLVHVLKVGVDIDGDKNVDLDGSRLYYAGVSAGGQIGMILFALEPDLRAAVFSTVGGWPTTLNVPAYRGAMMGKYLQAHVPTLLYESVPSAVKSIDGVAVGAPFFNENLPSRGKPVLVNDVAGAIPIQQKWEQFEWISNGAQAGAYAVYLRLKPLPGVPRRPFLIQTAVGDRTVPNDSTADMVEAGLLADRVTLYRHDCFALNQTYPEPHAFIIATADPASQQGKDVNSLVLLAQAQVAQFFASGGTVTPDPDGDGILFETPASFIPTGTNFIGPGTKCIH